MAKDDLARARAKSRPIFFGRELINASVALDFAGGRPLPALVDGKRPYCATAFLAPHWREVRCTDIERRHSFEDALAEYHRIKQALKE